MVLLEENKDDEKEISLDFSKIKQKTKKFFSGIKSEKTEDEEVSFDFKKVTRFTKKNSKWIIPLVFIIIAIFISSYFRVAPAYLPITEDWAQNQIYSYYQNQISTKINQQYPNLPAQNKQAMANTEFQKFLASNKNMVTSQIISCILD